MATPARIGELNAPSTDKYRDLPIATSPGTDNFRTLHYILRQFEAGNFFDPALLVDAMRRDDRFRAVMQTRVNGLLGAPIKYTPPDESDRAKQIAEAAEKTRVLDFTAGGPVADLLDWGLMLGIAVARLTWENRNGMLMPKLRVWHPQFIYWNWGTRTYHLIHEEGTIELPNTDEQIYSNGEWVVFTPFGFTGGWMKGLIRCLGKLYLGRGWAYRDWFRASEKCGMPVDLVYVPEAAPVDDKNSFFHDVSQRNAETALRCERNEEGAGGYDVKLLESVARTWETFKDLLDRLNTDIAVMMLGQNLTTEVQGGSFAAAKVSNMVRSDYQRADAQAIEHVLYNQVVYWWEKHNFGSNGLCPNIAFDLDPPEDNLADAQAMSALSQSLATFAQAGAPVDVRAILTDFAVPVKQEKDATDQANFAINPESQAAIIAVNEARSRAGLGPLMLPDGSTDPDGLLTIAEFREKKSAGAAPPVIVPPNSPPSGTTPPQSPAGVPPVASSLVVTTIKQQADGWHVYSADGSKHLGGPYATEEEARKRLAEVEHYKSTTDAAPVDTLVEKPKPNRYEDRLARNARRSAAEALKPDLEKIMSAVHEATSYDDMRKRLLSAFGDMDQKRLTDVIKKATIMAKLAGRHDVVKAI